MAVAFPGESAEYRAARTGCLTRAAPCDGKRQRRIDGGADFAVCMATFSGSVKAVERYPLTEEGWASA